MSGASSCTSQLLATHLAGGRLRLRKRCQKPGERRTDKSACPTELVVGGAIGARLGCTIEVASKADSKFRLRRTALDVQSPALHMAELAVLLNIGIGATNLAPNRAAASTQLLFRNGHHVHHVGPIGDTQRTHVGPHGSQVRILAHAMCSMDLDGLVDDTQGRPRRRDLDHGDVRLSSLESFFVGHDRGQVAQLPAHGDLDSRLRDGSANTILLRQEATECLAAMGPVNDGRQCELRLADGAHAVMDPARAQPALGDLEAAALAEDDVADRHPDVVEDDLGVVVLLAEDRQRPQDVHAWCVTWHEDHRLLLVQRSGKARFAKQHENLALGPDGARDPPLVAIDHILVTVSLDAR
mmetsp:Transcript_89875/g.257464  ORF Transcript_89875/g.257464 Transcript_89875/m.257464 type:complete len:354 (-) Transcript_89875:587-1648(-)